jgi:hypothetical protein
LLPGVLNQKFNKKMQEITPTTIQLRSFARKLLTYHEEKHKQTLVVNLERNAIKCQKYPSNSKCASLSKKIYPRRAQKSDLTSVSELCYVKMRENILNLYHPMTFN